MGFTIRNITEKDYPSVINMFKEFASFQKMPDKMVNSVEKIEQEQEHFHCFVAENDKNEIVGYATYFFAYYTWIGKSLYMDDLYVKEPYRKQGVGKKLLMAVIEFARKENCWKVRWQVSSWNTKAQAFYRNLGATVDSTEFNCDFEIK